MRPSELIDTLPTRTLHRPVSRIMQSSRDAELAGDLAALVFDQKADWHYREALAVLAELETQPVTLEQFLYRIMPGHCADESR